MAAAGLMGGRSRPIERLRIGNFHRSFPLLYRTLSLALANIVHRVYSLSNWGNVVLIFKTTVGISF
jgi:hypothetical protein